MPRYALPEGCSSRLRTALVAVAAVVLLACGPSVESVPSETRTSEGGTEVGAGRVGGTIAVLEQAADGGYAEVAAISLVDASVAAATTSAGAQYELRLSPGPYLLVVRTVGIADGAALQTSGTLEVGDEPLTWDLPALTVSPWLQAGASADSATQAGTVIGIGPIPMNGPPALGLGPSASGGMITGLVDPCVERGGKVVDLDPEVLDAIAREQQLSDRGELANPISVRPIPADIVVQGQVNVGPDGSPVVDLTVVDAATGETLRHIVVPGTPEDGEDIGPFLRRIGAQLAAELCDEQPDPVPATSGTPGTPATHPAPAAGMIRIAVSGPGSVRYHIWADSTPRICPPDCEVSTADYRFDNSIQRTMNLSAEEESSARLVAWGGACAYLDALVEPRGGACRLEDTGSGQSVAVTFEQRPRLTISVSGVPTSGGFRYTYSPPSEFTAPAPDREFVCPSPPCEFSFYFDLGTTVSIQPTQTQSLRRWGGGCAGTQGSDSGGILAETCTVELHDDTEVTMLRSNVSCINLDCTFDPP